MNHVAQTQSLTVVGNASSIERAASEEPCLIQCMGVVVRPHPGALARVIEPFAKLGVVLKSLNSRLYEEADEMVIDIQVMGLERQQIQIIANKIEALPITTRVVIGRSFDRRL